jgi:hypothetical protein
MAISSQLPKDRPILGAGQNKLTPTDESIACTLGAETASRWIDWASSRTFAGMAGEWTGLAAWLKPERA